MKKSLLLFAWLLIFVFSSFSQVSIQNQTPGNTFYSQAPDYVKNTKAFSREWWFYQQRAYPFDKIPDGAYNNSLLQREELRQQNLMDGFDFAWVSLGPTPGYYFNYGNISSRIVTGAYHPTDPNIIYVGPANGGVWKTTDAGSTWTPLTDNEASLAMGAIVLNPQNPNIILAGTGEATYSGASYYGRGLLRSTDGGASWTQITAGLPSSSYFSRIVYRPGRSNEILAALGYNGLYRSSDSGLSWNILLAGRVDDVLFSPAGDTAFAVGSGIGIRRSTDGGVSFSTFSTGLGTGERTHFDLCKANPAFMYAAVYGGGVVNIYKSSNFGVNWTQILSNLDGGSQAWYDLYLRVNPKNPDKVYCGAIDVFRSTNGGTTFENITNGYAGGSVHVDQHFLFFHPGDENTFIVTNDGGIYRTTDNGNSFTNLNAGLTLTQFYRITASPFETGWILGGTQDNGTQQTHSTINWAAAFGGDGGEVCFNPFNEDVVLGESQFNGLVKTLNGGTSWSGATNGISSSENAAWVAPIISHPTIDATFFTARQKLYKTTNNALMWTAVSGNINGTSAVEQLAISNTDPQIIFASTYNQLYKSTDGGVTFTNKTNGLPNKYISSIYVHPDDAQTVYVTLSGFGGSKVYKSTDGAEHWTSISGNLPDTPVNDIYVYTEDASNPKTYFVATDIGVFYTQNDGTVWTEITNGLPNTVILHLDYAPTTKMLRAGTHGRGVFEAFIDFTVPVELANFSSHIIDKTVMLNWQTATETNNSGFQIERKLKNEAWESIAFIAGSGTTTEVKSYTFTDDLSNFNYQGRILYRLKQIDFNGSYEYSDIVFADVNFFPTEITISQNYPNPFNPSTKIKYTLNGDSKVKLTIYNSVGQQIATLVDEQLSAGNYEIEWNAENFASGIYFYFFDVRDADNQKSIREIKKIVLMK